MFTGTALQPKSNAWGIAMPFDPVTGFDDLCACFLCDAITVYSDLHPPFAMPDIVARMTQYL
jgi:hypothetical protein